MLQQEMAKDYVVASGEQHSVREFVELTGTHLDMRIQWSGDGVEERGVDAKTGRTVVRVDPRYFRPAEVETLLGDPTRAETELGWRRTVSFVELVREMAQHDLKLAQRDALMQERGYRTANQRE
jgi:GDPmannose 4,6-dehydratase